ncbi:hypothetical protein MTR67_019096 [Solanum verrucosum]|uniref:Uncharacterized protein n=1 Tax=Solanum verrucosum TaxID=315347 RepID=A0AAF0QLY5_SOLVR|nr:hypothetical protein MTR67_019096 [Solanum verrucosum]
MLLGLILIVC